jgi:hypothetical protein
MEKQATQKAVEFQKGQSGNAKGLEKGIRSWSGLFRAYGQGKDISGRTRQERIIEELYSKALAGQRWAICEVLDRSMGKAVSTQLVDVTSGGQSLNAAVSFCKVGEVPVQVEEVKTVDALPAADQADPVVETEVVEPVRKKIQW